MRRPIHVYGGSLGTMIMLVINDNHTTDYRAIIMNLRTNAFEATPTTKAPYEYVRTHSLITAKPLHH